MLLMHLNLSLLCIFMWGEKDRGFWSRKQKGKLNNRKGKKKGSNKGDHNDDNGEDDSESDDDYCDYTRTNLLKLFNADPNRRKRKHRKISKMRQKT